MELGLDTVRCDNCGAVVESITEVPDKQSVVYDRMRIFFDPVIRMTTITLHPCGCYLRTEVTSLCQ